MDKSSKKWKETRSKIYYAQEGKCAICKSILPLSGVVSRSTNKAHLDHNHHTGKIRGVLCGTCNMGLGAFKDDPFLLAKAVQYLLKHTD